MKPLLIILLPFMIVFVTTTDICQPSITADSAARGSQCLGIGEPCSNAKDCITGVCYLGSCTRDNRGNPCSSSSQCHGFFSALECVQGHCIHIGAVGDVCSEDSMCSSTKCNLILQQCAGMDTEERCESDAQCTGALQCTIGRCHPLLPDGRACLSDEHCVDTCRDGWCTMAHNVSEGGKCETSIDCVFGLICGLKTFTCVKPVAATPDQEQIPCGSSEDCVDTNTQECACTLYPAPAYRCLTPGDIDSNLCTLQRQEYEQCMGKQACSLWAGLSLRPGQCSVDRCQRESYEYAACTLYNNPCRPQAVELVREWTGYDPHRHHTSSSTGGEPNQNGNTYSKPGHTPVAVKFFLVFFLSVTTGLLVFYIYKCAKATWLKNGIIQSFWTIIHGDETSETNHAPWIQMDQLDSNSNGDDDKEDVRGGGGGGGGGGAKKD